MELNDRILINSTDGDDFIIRRLLKSDRRGLQEFGNSLSKESTASFLPHSYDDNTVNAFLERSETGKDLSLGLFRNDKIIAYFFLWYYTNPIPSSSFLNIVGYKNTKLAFTFGYSELILHISTCFITVNADIRWKVGKTEFYQF